jgi:uncharacterized protein (TIGR00369 family)
MSAEDTGAAAGAELYQQIFSDSVPHQKELGLKIVSVARGHAVMQLDWQECLVGNPETGVLHGGAITTLLDACCGMAVASKLTDPQPFATLDLRIDYVRPATPRLPVIAEAECFKITHNVAFFRAFAHHGDKADPIASAAGTFMLATKGQARAAQAMAFGDGDETAKKQQS